MCGADQLEAWGWLEDRSTVSLVKLDPLAISSVMREKSLLKLVTLPRSLDSESKQHFINMSHRRAWVAPTNKGLPPSFNVPKAPVLSAPPQLNIVFRCIKQRHLQGKAGAIPPRFCSHMSAAQTVSSSNTTAKAWTKHHLHLWNWPSLTWKSTLMWLPH